MNERDQKNIVKIRQLAEEGIFGNAILKRAEDIFAKQSVADRFSNKELVAQLTLRVLSFYNRECLFRTEDGLENLLTGCLENQNKVKSLNGDKSSGDSLMRSITSTIEKFWQVAEKKFAGLTNDQLENVVDKQWWEVKSRADGYTSTEWQIAVRCATAQQNKEDLGTVINTIYHCFSVSPPAQYQDAPIRVFIPQEREGRPARNRSH